MVYMMSTTRAGRPNKEKTSKSNTSHNSKSDGPPSSQKYQPTSEQMRMAQITKTSNKSTEDPVMEAKIDQLAEMSGRSKDEACFALHDCDYDLNRAIEKLLENENQCEWQEMKTKKKKSATKSESEPIIEENHVDPVEINNHKSEREYNDRPYERSGSGPRGRRNDKAPPRFQRAGRGRNQNDDERMDRGDSQSRDRGRGRGGRGGSRGRGRGRGGGGPRRDDNRGRNNYDDGPGLPIDTWTNDVAEESKHKKKDNSFGNWGDMAEDWTADEWQGSLKESTVFTSSVNNETSKMFSDNDAKMFSVNSIETQAFNNSLSNSMPSPPRISDSYQHSNASLQQSSLGPEPLQGLAAPPKPIGQNSIGQNSVGQNSIGQAPIGQNSSMGQSSTVGSGSMGQNSLGQRLDLGMLLSAKPAEYKPSDYKSNEYKPTEYKHTDFKPSEYKPNEYKPSDYNKPVDSVEALSQQTAELTKETAHFMAQFQKNLAAESIKNAVGIGSSSNQAGTLNLGQPSSHERPTAQPPQMAVVQPQSAVAPQQQSAPVAMQPSASQQHPQQPQSAQMAPSQPTPQTTASVTSVGAAVQHHLQQQHQPKQQRPLRTSTKLPPPSKIPASAVVMPGAGSGSNFSSLDVEFGCFPESPGGFSFGSIQGAPSSGVNNTYNSSAVSASLNSHINSNTTTIINNKSAEPSSAVSSVMTSSTSAVTPQQSAAAMSAMLETITQQQQQTSQSPRPPAVFQNSTPATPPKDYSQSTKISSPPDPIPFPTSQTDRKSPYQTSGPLASEQTNQGQLSYSQPSYSSNAYQSSSYKSTQPAISSSPSAGGSYSGHTVSTGNLAGASSLNQPHSVGLQNYQSTSFQSPPPPVAVGSSFSTGTSHQAVSSALYPGAGQQQQTSSFQSTNASYQQQQQQQQQQSSVGSSGNAGSSSGSASGGSGIVTGGSYPNQSSYHHHSRDSQSAPAFQSSTGGSASSAYQVGVGQSSNSASSSYQRDNSQNVGGSQQSSAYTSQLTASYGSGSAAATSGSTVGGPQSTSSAVSHLSSSKLSESLGKLTVKDNSSTGSSSVGAGVGSVVVNNGLMVDKSVLTSSGVAPQYDVISSSTNNSTIVGVGTTGGVGSVSLTANTNTTASAIATANMAASAAAVGISNTSVNSVGGSMSSSAHQNVSVSKSSLPISTKAPMNLPPGMPPLIGHQQTPNYMIGQPSFPIAAFGLQQPLYSYEDLLHQRLPLHSFNYDNLASFQHSANAALSGMDQNKLAQVAAAASYSAADINKMNRHEAHSPVNAQTSQTNAQSTQQQQQQTASQQQTQQQTQSAAAAHGQAYIQNPTAGLPGYYNYYVGGLPQAGYPYPYPLPVNNMMPTVTNSGVTTTNTQFQKPQAYNYGTGYDSLSAMSGQTHDFTKAYSTGGASQTQNKAAVNASLVTVSSNSDLTGGAGSGYPKAHQQAAAAFDKSGFAAGTPPPFNIPPGLPTGTQAGALGGATPAYMPQYAMPAAAAAMAHAGPMLHQLHQDNSAGSVGGRSGQQGSSQAGKSMVGTAKGPTGYTGYWGN